MSVSITSPFRIRQYENKDPVVLRREDTWVKKTISGPTTIGMPMGLLLTLTYAGTSALSTVYQLSYRTKEDTTKRDSLT